MERSGGARPGETGSTTGKGTSTEEQDAAERRDTRHIATGRTKSGKSTCRRDVNTPEHEFSRDHTTHLMECRVIHRGALRHHYNRMREADLSGLRETIHNFYQLQEEAPAGETAARGTKYTHSTLEPPSRNDEKNVWTRSDSKAVRRHEEERMRPEHTLTKFMATSIIWMQEVSPVVQQNCKRGASSDT